jgi:hypothetical protein
MLHLVISQDNLLLLLRTRYPGCEGRPADKAICEPTVYKNCTSLDVSHLRGPPRSVTGISLHLHIPIQHCIPYVVFSTRYQLLATVDFRDLFIVHAIQISAKIICTVQYVLMK